MRKISLVCVLVLVIFASCKKDQALYTLGVDVQEAFEQDNVQVFIDGETVISSRLTTNHALGVCPDGIIKTSKNKGKHEIKVVINNTAVLTNSFSLKRDLYIGVEYNRQSGAISLEFSKYPFLYD